MGHDWRWYQGRLEYFRFENLREIAKSLASLSGVEINQKGLDPLRPVLEHDTGLPFSPKDYRVWRNYSRVFGCALLATRTGDNLFTSDLCHRLSDGRIRDVDEYLTALLQRFRYPSPVFESYDPAGLVVFPFAALLKSLAAMARAEEFPSLSVEDVFALLIGNRCTGLEAVGHYLNLKPTDRRPSGDEERQVREMMAILSQFSFLKWSNKRLFLDTGFDLESYLADLRLSARPPEADRSVEFAAMSSVAKLPKLPAVIGQPIESGVDLVFTEGKRSRISHLRIERSPLLRRLFFEKHTVVVCQMCELRPRMRYPWTDNLLEIHHLLPLSSGVAVTTVGTSLDDIVPLCPNCHRSVHVYYKLWLNTNQAADFASRAEARAVYAEAKKKVAL